MSELAVDRILGRSLSERRPRGSDSLSVSLVFSRRPDILGALEGIVDKKGEFTSADTKRFNEIMEESFRDSPIHFGSSVHWRKVRNLIKKSKNAEVPIGVSRVFHRNPEAARLLLEEMATSWADPETRSPIYYFTMTRVAAMNTVRMLRARPEEVLKFIGARYAIGDHYNAAYAFKWALELASRPLGKQLKP